MGRRPDTLLAAWGVLMASVLESPLAFAHGDVDREKVERPSAAESSGAGGDEAGAATGEDTETRFTIGLDVVVGFGKTLAADQTPPDSLNATPVNLVDSDPVHPDSFLFSWNYEALRHLGFGARLPLVVGSILPDGYQSRPISALGNLELEGEYATDLSRRVALVYALGIGLPTAEGAQVPDTTADLAGKAFNASAYDRYSILYAAAASRGFEENALFFPNRFGVVPKVALEYRGWGGLRLEPFVKLENMISTSSDNARAYLGELVFGARVAYRVNDYVETGLRAWATVVVAGADEGPVVVVEPELRLHFGVFGPYLGLILPVAGPLASDPSRFVGVRLGAVLAF